MAGLCPLVAWHVACSDARLTGVPFLCLLFLGTTMLVKHHCGQPGGPLHTVIPAPLELLFARPLPTRSTPPCLPPDKLIQVITRLLTAVVFYSSMLGVHKGCLSGLCMSMPFAWGFKGVGGGLSGMHR